jgi:hypothetical protein
MHIHSTEFHDHVPATKQQLDASNYMTEIVDPTISDFEANPTSRRHAFLACVVTYHTIDYLTRPKSPRILVKSFRDKSPEFALVDLVANAFKHVENRPLRAEHVYSRPPALAGVAQCGISRAGDTTGGVALWGEDTADLLPTVKLAARFLRTKCK